MGIGVAQADGGVSRCAQNSVNDAVKALRWRPRRQRAWLFITTAWRSGGAAGVGVNAAPWHQAKEQTRRSVGGVATYRFSSAVNLSS